MSPLHKVVQAVRYRVRLAHLLWGLPWLVLLGYLTHVAWFLTDDAFISFRYARNLLEGHGLVYNPGEYVEGYSNFLWVLELAALWGVFGWRPEHTAPWLSVACTGGTLATIVWWTARLPGLPQRRLVGWMVLGLVCSSATFAVWTSAGGLETRQFTLFLVLAVVGLTLYPAHRRALLGVSLSLAAAALTRPEGPLFAACCFGWYAGQRRVDTGTWRRDWRDVAWLVGPFVVLVGAHYLFRYTYYDEWLPNTYYAKYVRPWYEMGIRYLLVAAVDTGLYLLLPLAGLALVRDWWAHRKLTYALPLLCIGFHMTYLARLGGDHFGYRPLDIYWPLLAVPAAVGVVHLSGWLVTRFGTSNRDVCPWELRSCALIIFLPVVLYCGAIQVMVPLLNHKGERNQSIRLTRPQEKTIGLLLTLPGIPTLIALSANPRRTLRGAWIRAEPYLFRKADHSRFIRWQPYQNMERGLIPDDALAFVGDAGVAPYFVPDLKFIDYPGLTDTTIARNPVTTPNSHRKFAHERFPPSGYLAERGVNFSLYGPAASVKQALKHARYAVQVGPNIWMPFNAPSLEWVAARFEQFAYDKDTDQRFEEKLKRARLLGSGTFDIYLDGTQLLYVKDRCDYEPAFFLHVIPKEMGDLPAGRIAYEFENLDFRLTGPAPLRTTYRCTAVRTLPDYPIAAITTGQFNRGSGERLWEREFRFGDSGHAENPKER